MKTSHKVFCLATSEKLVKDWSVGSYFVLKINTIFTGDIQLVAIGYKYNYSKILEFIATEGAGNN